MNYEFDSGSGVLILFCHRLAIILYFRIAKFGQNEVLFMPRLTINVIHCQVAEILA